MSIVNEHDTTPDTGVGDGEEVLEGDAPKVREAVGEDEYEAPKDLETEAETEMLGVAEGGVPNDVVAEGDGEAP